MFAIILALGSLGVALTILLFPPPPGRERPRTLRWSWAMWCLQPAVLFGTLLVALPIMALFGYTLSNAPEDVQRWLSLGTFGSVGLVLLAGTVLGGLAWSSARREQPATSHRWWALAATVANALWFAGGAWIIAAPPVVIGLDVLIVVLALALLLWPLLRPGAVASPQSDVVQPDVPATSPDEHLVG